MENRIELEHIDANINKALDNGECADCRDVDRLFLRLEILEIKARLNAWLLKYEEERNT